MQETIMQAHIKELRTQRDALLAQNIKLRQVVGTIPNIILNARLDAKAGRETKYTPIDF